MLYKKELLGVPLLKKPKRSNKNQIAVAIADLPKSGKVLVADFFKNGTRTRFFTNGETYQTFVVGTEKFTQNYPDDGWWCSNYYETAECAKVVNSFFNDGYSHTAYYGIRQFIGRKKEEVYYKAQNRKQELMKSHFKMFPEYPRNLNEYCENNVFQNGYMFIQKKDKSGNRYGVCSHCGNKTLLDGERRLVGYTDCPKCGHAVEYKQSWRNAEITDTERLCITHKVDGQLLIRWLKVTRTYKRPSLTVAFEYDDYAYQLYLKTKKGNTSYFYKYFNAPYGYGEHWIRLKGDDVCYDDTYVYTDNLCDVFGDKYYNVNLKSGLQGKKCKLAFGILLYNLKFHPVAEYLFKLGLPIMASTWNLIADESKADKGLFYRVMGVSKQYLPMYRDMNVTMQEHRIIRNCKQFVHPKDLQELRSFRLKDGDYELVREMLQTMTLHKFIRYFKSQLLVKRKKQMSLKKLMIEYRDYISMSRALNVYLNHKSVRFPPDIFKAHSLITERYNLHRLEIERKKNEQSDREFREKMQGLYASLGVSDYSDDEFCVKLPQSRTDFITEGQSLNHCVGLPGYYQRHMDGTRMIFFIRKSIEPNVPFFTMELDMTTFKICQLYGFGDCSAPNDVRTFCEKFVDFIRKAKIKKSA